MHKNIKKYTQNGYIRDDSDIPRLRGELEKLMAEEMKQEGYLPVHDMGSHWSTTYLDNRYSFKLTMYFSYAGKVKAKEYDFWYNGKLQKIG